ncbi:SDR family NAD(P)-dependent oxidoreductase [Pontixanthobacter gangjinensis]|uniref:SDR family NAD(P)-dependent oxidoreductase n=1 Tax=Pontixanthobacter gangjinensis TaxID=1028742 RepID=A0A6I4SNX5_9SPHN|nr:SDR family NAD(P)-dependent oxidoreductase [Pontixanthobacter gangjinensis]MXO57463.1 SDR family NAD(P)-dependent oxidoreductase [Pontixanthobacter gangjinensis]
MNFENKTVWITGASSGIGAALAREWAGRGAKIVLSGRDEARLASVANELHAESLLIPFDVRDEAAMLEATAGAIAWNGSVDVFVANAGVSQRSQALKTDMQVYRDIIDIDLTSQIAATQALLPHMADRGSGALVFISSIAGKVGVPMRTAYSAAKFGLIGYADALRAEMSVKGVNVHVIAPGSIATNVSRNALSADGSKRGKSDSVIDNGIKPADAAKTMVDGIAAGQREIIVAQGMEEAMGEMRRTPDQLLDQMAGMVAAGYIERMEAEG